MPTRLFISNHVPTPSNSDLKQWFVLRDLKRVNAKRRHWQELRECGFEVFTPMRQITMLQGGKRIRMEVPVVSDLLFVYSSKSLLDPIVAKTPTLQYRWLKCHYMKPMTVSDTEMQRFIVATQDVEKVRYYAPGEVTQSMIGKPARIVGGPLNGYEGRILSIRGARVKRLLVELPGLITAGIEVNPEFMEIIEK